MRCKRFLAGVTIFATSALAFPAFAQTLGAATVTPANTGNSGVINTSKKATAVPRQLMPKPRAARLERASAAKAAMHTAKQGVPLAELTNSKDKILAASVENASGHSIGTVQNVQTNAMGRASIVDVRLATPIGGTKIVKIKATALRYNQNGNLLTTHLSQTEINALPSASKTKNL